MSMRLYKVSGQYYTWDYLHNELGYTESASTTTAYKSSDSDTWGQSIVDSGYRIAEDSSDLETYEFWIENVSGWFNASEMAREGYYPSFATDGPRFVKEGELSVSVEISGNSWSGVWYLLKKDVAIGWCTERELEENGWEPDRGEIVGGLISGTYDKRIYSFGNGGLLVPGGYAYSDDDLLDMQWDFGGMVEEYSPVVSLPTVSSTGDFGDNWVYANASFAVQSISPDSGSRAKYNWRGYANDITYDDSKSYAVIQWQETDGARAGATEFSMEKASNYLFIKNISSQTLNFLKAHIAVCSSNQTEIVIVCNSSNEAFNAFRYTLNGTDYYYVLDETQTDWTDDLSSIGYSDSVIVLLGLKYRGSSWQSVQFSQGGYYWWAGILSAEDKALMESMGIYDATSYPYGEVLYSQNYNYECIAMYSDMGETPVPGFDASNFYVSKDTSYPCIVVNCYNAFNVSVKTWKCKITPKSN